MSNSNKMDITLSLINLITLEYNIDSDHLILTRNIDGGEQSIFEGSLDEWKNLSTNDYQKNPDFAADFDNTIVDLLNAKEYFQHHFIFGGTHYLCRCKTVDTPDGKVVYGVLQPEYSTVGGLTHQYRRASDKDPMLDVLNKKAITEYAKHVMVPGAPTSYLCILDLDNFKTVNDTYGHMFGDKVLETFVSIMKKAVANHGMVGRIGGDEFLIITKDVPDKSSLRYILREIRMNMELAYQDQVENMALTCSIGAAAYPDNAKSYEDVMALSDKLLYLAKEKGRNRYIIYTPDLHSGLVQQSGEKGATVKTSTINFDNRVGMMHYLVDNYLFNQQSSNAMAMERVGKAFGLGIIMLMYDGWLVAHKWTPDNAKLTQDDYHIISKDSEIFKSLDDNNMVIIDGLYNLDKKDVVLRDKLASRDIQSAIICAFNKNDISNGYVLFGKVSSRQKWSETEILALSTAAKMIEMYVNGKKIH